MFQIQKIHDCETYTDYMIYRKTLHDIVLTHYHESNSHEAMIARVKDEAESFKNYRRLPQVITQKLVKLTSKDKGE